MLYLEVDNRHNTKDHIYRTFKLHRIDCEDEFCKSYDSTGGAKYWITMKNMLGIGKNDAPPELQEARRRHNKMKREVDSWYD